MNTYADGCLEVYVSYGTDFVEEIDSTLAHLSKHNFVKDIEKTPGVNSINYLITFNNAEGAFLFGRSRPQLKL